MILRHLLITVIVAVSAFAASWVTPEEALASAQLSNKPILLFIYRDGCAACEDIAFRFASRPYYEPALNSFELAKIPIEDSNSRLNLDVEKTPTFFFINKNREEVAPKIEGSPKDDLEFTDYLYKAVAVSKMTEEQ